MEDRSLPEHTCCLPRPAGRKRETDGRAEGAGAARKLDDRVALANSEQPSANEQRTTNNGQRTTNNGERTTDNAPTTAACTPGTAASTDRAGRTRGQSPTSHRAPSRSESRRARHRG